MENIVTTGAVISYAMWSSGPKLVEPQHPDATDVALCVVWNFFDQLLSDPEEIVRRSDTRLEQGGTSERPEEVLPTDLPILITVLGWIITSFGILPKNQE